MLWDGGFAGICFPKEYGGLGPRASSTSTRSPRSRCPTRCRCTSTCRHFSIMGATLLDFGTPTSRSAKYLPPHAPGRAPVGAVPLRADRRLRPRRVRHRAPTRDGDEWVLNGSKIWSTAAMSATHAHLPGPHRLGRAEAPRPHHVRHGDPPGGRAGRPDPAGQRVARVLPGVLRRRAAPARLRHRRRERRLDRRAGAARARTQRGRRRFAVRERAQLPRRGRRRRVRRQLREDRDRRAAPPTTRSRASSSPRPTCSTSCSAAWCSASASAWRPARSSASRPRSPSCSPPRRPSARPTIRLELAGPTRSPGRPAPRRSVGARARTSWSARRRASPAAATRSSATSSPSGCSACPASGRPTATSRSRTYAATRCPPHAGSLIAMTLHPTTPPSTSTGATACASGPTSSAIRTAPPVVLLHGGGQTRFAWGTTAPVLAERGWHVLPRRPARPRRERLARRRRLRARRVRR